MKILIILLLILVLLVLFAVRFRRQITAAIEIFKMFRQLRNQIKQPEKKIEIEKQNTNVNLVRCARCGDWVPENKALSLRSKTFYCSAQCMEKEASFTG